VRVLKGPTFHNGTPEMNYLMGIQATDLLDNAEH